MIFSAQSADGNGSAVRVESDGRVGVNPRLLAVWGDFGGGTFTIEHSFDGGTTWIAGEGILISAATVTTLYVKPGQLIRGVLTDSSAASLNADLI